MSNPFDGFSDSPSAPALRCFAIVPHDTDALPSVTKAIRADAAGTICFRPAGQSEDVTHPVVAGERIDVRATHVRATGTTGQTVIIGYA